MSFLPPRRPFEDFALMRALVVILALHTFYDTHFAKSGRWDTPLHQYIEARKLKKI
jgi:hypothetical protein